MKRGVVRDPLRSTPGPHDDRSPEAASRGLLWQAPSELDADETVQAVAELLARALLRRMLQQGLDESALAEAPSGPPGSQGNEPEVNR